MESKEVMEEREEDIQLREMFRGFDPELSSDSLFMAALKGRMEAMEDVKREQERFRRASSRGAAVAALAGFIAGILMTLLTQHLMPMLARIPSIASSIPAPALDIAASMLPWLLTALTAVAAAMGSYRLVAFRSDSA